MPAWYECRKALSIDIATVSKAVQDFPGCTSTVRQIILRNLPRRDGIFWEYCCKDSENE